MNNMIGLHGDAFGDAIKNMMLIINLLGIMESKEQVL